MPRKGIDISGKKFGILTAIKRHDPPMSFMWYCECECGGKSIVNGTHLRSGHTKSCGCLEGYHKHGMSESREHNTWIGMRARCFNKSHRSYKYYGDRGITVCERWLEFENFYSDMGKQPDGLELERCDNNGNYELSNCKWATRIDQLYNRQNTVKVKHNGKICTMRDLSKASGIRPSIIRGRLRLGWSVDRAIGD